MGRILAIAAIAAALFAGTVLYALDLPARPLGYAGIEFAMMTPSAAARTPLLAKGAYIYEVDQDSPAAKAESSEAMWWRRLMASQCSRRAKPQIASSITTPARLRC